MDIWKIQAHRHFWTIFSLSMLHTHNNDKSCWYSLSARKNESKTFPKSQIWTYWKFKHLAIFWWFSAYLCLILKIPINHADIRYQHLEMNRKDSLKAKFGHIENSSLLILGRFSAYLCFILKIMINHNDVHYQHAKTNRKHSIKAKLGHMDNSSPYTFLDDFQLIYASYLK